MSSTIFPFLRTSSDFSPFHYVEDDYSNEKDYELSSEVLRFQEDQLQLRSFAQLLYVLLCVSVIGVNLYCMACFKFVDKLRELDFYLLFLQALIDLISTASSSVVIFINYTWWYNEVCLYDNLYDENKIWNLIFLSCDDFVLNLAHDLYNKYSAVLYALTTLGEVSVVANGLIVLIMSYERYIIICRPEKKQALDSWKPKMYLILTVFFLILPIAIVVEGLLTTHLKDGNINKSNGQNLWTEDKKIEFPKLGECEHCIFNKFYLRQIVFCLCTFPTLLLTPLFYYQASKTLTEENLATKSASNRSAGERKTSLAQLFGLIGVSYFVCFLPFAVMEIATNYAEIKSPTNSHFEVPLTLEFFLGEGGKHQWIVIEEEVSGAKFKYRVHTAQSYISLWMRFFSLINRDQISVHLS
ncbi:uncharacterized protein LOC134855603, partial [Symsagittifera roscoffensis]|uniref:uncharacterized protein LOC134855603 n=1 Tax=Symsagittifera roscoffensis TaxID=84072 RepID=UPI00307B44CA